MAATSALQGKPLPETTRRQILSAAITGLSLRAVAAANGVSNPTVLRVWRRAGIDRKQLLVRNALVEEHRWLADRIAKSVSRDMPLQMRSELPGVAAQALIESASAFDSTRGVAFAAYAQQRIRGACLDSVRRRHWTNGTAQEHTREASESRPDETVSAEASAIQSADRARVLDAIAKLPGRHAVLIFLHYIDERTLEQIAPMLGVGASRLSQLHREALGMLKERMNG